MTQYILLTLWSLPFVLIVIVFLMKIKRKGKGAKKEAPIAIQLHMIT
jgi:hypothetical protein